MSFALIQKVNDEQKKAAVVDARSGDTVRVHQKIKEGNKERIQIFEGLVIKRHRKNDVRASFTVRKVSYNVGVERTFLLHSPRIEKIQVVSKGHVRRARLFYLRPLRGKASRIHSEMVAEDTTLPAESAAVENGSASVKDDAPPAQEAVQESIA